MHPCRLCGSEEVQGPPPGLVSPRAWIRARSRSRGTFVGTLLLGKTG